MNTQYNNKANHAYNVCVLLLVLMFLPSIVVAEQSRELSDTWLEAKLETTYLFNSQINPFEIDAEVENGVAHLSGAVDESVDKDLAEEIAKDIRGAKKVRNELEIAK